MAIDRIAEIDALAGGWVSSEPPPADGRDPATLNPQPAMAWLNPQPAMA